MPALKISNDSEFLILIGSIKFDRTTLLMFSDYTRKYLNVQNHVFLYCFMHDFD